MRILSIMFFSVKIVFHNMNNISWEKNAININGDIVTLKYPVLEVKEVQDILLVVTVPTSGVNNNLFGISVVTKKIWEVQDYTEIVPEFSQTPYVGITILNNKIIATDFCGCKFIVNPIDGKIIGREQSSK